jgi:hypothetical protein
VWRRVGRIFVPPRRAPWMLSHASCPVALRLQGSVYRVYFSTRDASGRSSVGYFDFDLRRPSSPLEIAPRPVLSPGPPGTFDDRGVTASSIVRHRGRLFLYYLGWNLSPSSPFRNSIGLAVSLDASGRRFRRYEGPVLDRDQEDPYSLSFPWVLKERGRFRMWYASNVGWGSRRPSRMKETMAYAIKFADSRDGFVWRRRGTSLAPRGGRERIVTKPCVVRDERGYRMWFCRRGRTYAIAEAASADGRRWSGVRPALTPGAAGWEDEAVAYPFVFVHRESRYMLYNGNDYGREGIGLAVEETGGRRA